MTFVPYGGWARWTVVLLKPDCLARGLVDPVIDAVAEHLSIVEVRTVFPAEEQIFAHYADMLPLSDSLGVDVPAELSRIYIGQPTGIALAYGPQAAPRLRAQLGDTDPAVAGPETIRGRFGNDSLPAARSRGQLINNLIHSSDTVDAVPRDFAIWYGTDLRHLLRPPSGGLS